MYWYLRMEDCLLCRRGNRRKACLPLPYVIKNKFHVVCDVGRPVANEHTYRWKGKVGGAQPPPSRNKILYSYSTGVGGSACGWKTGEKSGRRMIG